MIVPDGEATHDIGVMKLGYFLFSVKTHDQTGEEVVPGWMRVRRFADVSVDQGQNGMMVFNMFKNTDCQSCSDKAVRNYCITLAV
jgi:hypothetical protein